MRLIMAFPHVCHYTLFLPILGHTLLPRPFFLSPSPPTLFASSAFTPHNSFLTPSPPLESLPCLSIPFLLHTHSHTNTDVHRWTHTDWRLKSTCKRKHLAPVWVCLILLNMVTASCSPFLPLRWFHFSLRLNNVAQVHDETLSVYQASLWPLNYIWSGAQVNFDMELYWPLLVNMNILQSLFSKNHDQYTDKNLNSPFKNELKLPDSG